MMRCSFCGAELISEDCPNYGSGPEHAPVERRITARDLHYRDKEATYFLREVQGITFPDGFKITDTHAASMIAGWWFTVEYEQRWGGVRGQVFVPGETVLLVEVKVR